MFVCASVVEGSTKEEIWIINQEKIAEIHSLEGPNAQQNHDQDLRPTPLDPATAEILGSKDGKPAFHLFWLQRGASVNDQNFDSYAIFAHGPRTSVQTSRVAMITPNTDPGNTPMHSSQFRSQSMQLNDSIPFKFLATLGAVTGAAGFVLQFTGLRSMHWGASIAQLVATLIMAVVRAWVRRGLVLRPTDYKIPQDHELDWIATRISRSPERLWPRWDWGDSDSEKIVDGFLGECCWDWGIETGTKIYSPPEKTAHQGPRSHGLNEVVKIRGRLARLSGWIGPTSDLAISTAKSIEAIMNACFPNTEDTNVGTLNWWLNGRGGVVDLSVKRINGQWKANASEIDAVLSLWLYSIQHPSDKPQAHPEDEEGPQKVDDWLRDGALEMEKLSVRLLGKSDDSLFTKQIAWYMGPIAKYFISNVEFVKAPSGSIRTHYALDELKVVARNRLFGFTDISPRSDTTDSHPPEDNVTMFVTDVSPRPDTTDSHPPEDNVTMLITKLPEVGSPSSLHPSWSSSCSTASTSSHDRASVGPSRSIRPLRFNENENYSQSLIIPPSFQAGTSSSIGNDLPSSTSSESKYLAMISQTPLKSLLAQEMLSIFMWAAGARMKRLGTEPTVLEELSAQRLVRLGTDGIITDRIDLFSPSGR